MKKLVIMALMGIMLGHNALASHAIPVIGCDQGKIISADNGDLHCLSHEVPCLGKLLQLSESEGGPGLVCVKDCQYIDRAEGGEGLVCSAAEGR